MEGVLDGWVRVGGGEGEERGPGSRWMTMMGHVW